MSIKVTIKTLQNKKHDLTVEEASTVRYFLLFFLLAFSTCGRDDI
jgi:hypothetical protein